MIKIKISSVIFNFLILIILSANYALTIPTDTTQSQQTEVNEEVMVTAYPDTRKRFVDLNYVSPEVSGLLQRSNLNIQQIREQQEKLKARNAQYNNFYVSTNSRPTTQFSSILNRSPNYQNSSPSYGQTSQESSSVNYQLISQE